MKREWLIWTVIGGVLLILIILGASGVFESDWTHGTSDSVGMNVGGLLLQIEDETQLDASSVAIDATLENTSPSSIAMPELGNALLEDHNGRKFVGRLDPAVEPRNVPAGERAAIRWVFQVPSSQTWPMLLRLGDSKATHRDLHMTLSGPAQWSRHDRHEKNAEHRVQATNHH